ncbi:MAG: DNA alkylation repair protein [Clostridia bacterium]|nr:DNA alkylation repair protein [Clostridia bacterium]
MELNKEIWKNKDIEEFNKYLESIKRPEKIEFAKRTINTEMEVLGIPFPDLRKISKEISKGNYLSFLDSNNNRFYENTIINACLINLIKDFEQKKKNLNKLYIDNWSTCDILSFKIKGLEREYWRLSEEYIKNKDLFKRRVGIRILFSYKNNSEYVDKIFKLLDNLYDENEYYVNMAIAWLLCELMIYNRDKTLKYLEHHNLNDFTINKAISKCRDSFRVSKEDKELLLKYKISFGDGGKN